MSPRRAIALTVWMMLLSRRRHALFHVLHLLAELLDRGLELEADIGELDVIGLGAQRVGFAVEFLGRGSRAGGRSAPPCPIRVCACATWAARRSSSSRTSALVGDQDRLLVQPVGVEALGCASSVATCSASRARDRFGPAARRPFGALGQRVISLNRVDSMWPSAAPSWRRIAASAPSASAKPADAAASALTPLVLALLGFGDIDHALERKQAVERRRRGIDARCKLPHGAPAPPRGPPC